MKRVKNLFKGVIFDLDGTLYDYHSNDIVAMKSLCQYAKEQFNISEDKFREIFIEAKKLVRTRLKDGGARHSRFLHCQAALELLNQTPFHHAAKMDKIYWDAFFKQIQLYDGALDFLQYLKSNGVKIAICTDMTTEVQYNKIKYLRIADLIDTIVTSEETGLNKPSSVMFELVLEKLKLQPSEVAYFGDSLERDVEGAAKSGLTPFWFIADRQVDENATTYKKVKSYHGFKF